MNREIVRLDRLTVEAGGNRILDDLTMSVREGDFLGIIGPNGAGKTTLLRVILGLQKSVSGSVRVFGVEPATARKRVGYVPQRLFFDRDFPMTVLETVLMGRLPIRGLLARYNASDRKAAIDALETTGLSALRHRRVGSLSGGELQRMLIARALAGTPELLLLDEPTASVDPGMKTSIYDLLDTLRGTMTIMLVTHDTGAISSRVTRVACLNCRMNMHEEGEIGAGELSRTYTYPVDKIRHEPSKAIQRKRSER
ncbi:ABC transporter [Prosthecochloris sp. GSB1]|uniref:metal ABC transporter ATP-binding protein n=1 Tax=Prosthecochloris sp. GSB1 TaxID=281093 RepID=UPI000B8C839E|nr:ABC transporter ATP-binding protein [Prosthecochloris sp. GSB1]ASQ89675.1 ABC transporter [Prosthecochloris sp. GSB1]